GSNGGRLYKTGDLGRFLDGGIIEYCGRADFQVKVRGFRIELTEIENVLRFYEKVTDAVVAAKKSHSGNIILVAYIITEGTEKDLSQELKKYLLERLPEYMVPTFFVSMKKFPLTTNGKVDRKALPDYEIHSSVNENTFILPRTKLERYLASLWKDILGIDRISIYDNFFELGGNSIQAAVLINRLQKELKEEAQVRAIFLAPTIAELALYINEYFPELIAKRFYDGTYAELENGSSEEKLSLSDKNENTIIESNYKNAIIKTLENKKIQANDVEELRRIIKAPFPIEQKNKNKNPRAIFVLSPPRSGSTLLRVMMAGNPKLFSPPELELLSFNTLGERYRSLNGRYNLWLDATVRALKELKDCSTEEAERLMHKLEENDITAKEFYLVLQEMMKGRILVDKTPSYPLCKEILLRAEEYFDNPLYIHLTRHPYASIYSFVEAKLDQSFFRYSHDFNSRELAELIWIISHQNISDFLSEIPEERKLKLKFEDLVEHPQPELEKICNLAAIEFHPDMLKPYEGKKMTDPVRENSQMVGDYKFYLRNKIDQNVTSRWKKFHFQDFLSDLAWSIAENLGYKNEAKSLQERSSKEDMRKELKEIEIVDRKKDLSLSFAQQRLWFLDQMEPDNPFYNISTAFKITGNFDEEALKNSLHQIVLRHEILRTTFPSADGKPTLNIHDSLPFGYRSVDLSKLEKEIIDQEIQSLVNQEASITFNLTEGPLLRALLIKLSDQENILVITMHHIISDGWSMNVFINEITHFYGLSCGIKTDPLSELSVQYADYSVWQREQLKGDKLKEQSEYWKAKLEGIPSMLELPTDFMRPPIQRYMGDRISFAIEEDLYDEVIKLDNKYNVTPFMSFIAAFELLLFKYSDQTDLCIGTPVAGRNINELENLIGFFANTVVLRGDLSANPSFIELLKRTYDTTVEALSNQDIPFEKLVDLLQPSRNMSYTPLFQVMLSYNRSNPQMLDFDGLKLTPLRTKSKVSKFDLSVEVLDKSNVFKIDFEYNTDLFKESTIRQMISHFQNLIKQVVQSPEKRISDIEILSNEEY
ncbi:MAG: condensation domain-containing protein, partial [Bacteroidota bacterium]|nr:condensation domain-containing protein [Bacteroidota bacterium]MDP4197655.1 condensation domain-containing protein [Bacteroidota bacterium]